MTSGEPPTGPSAARIGGFTLIGIGVLALVFGTASMFAGERDTAAEPSTGPVATSSRTDSGSGSTPTETSSTGSAEGTGGPTSSTASEESSAPSSPPQRVPSESRSPESTGSREGGGSDSSGKSASVSLRVYNNSKVEGLAHRAADDLRGAGFDVVEVGNYAGRIPVTTVYYRPGTGERAQAETVARRLDVRAESRFDGISDASPGVIVIVTKNYDGLG